MIAVTVLLFVVFFIIYEKYYKSKRTNLPGPPCVPLVGHAFEFLTSEDPMYVIDRMYHKYGDIIRVWLGNDLYVFMTNPEDIEVLLNSYKHTVKAISYKYFSCWMGNGLITSHGETWKLHRKLLTPTFHFKILENSVKVIHRNAKILTEILAKELHSEGFDVHPYIEKCSLDVIVETAMGIKMNVQTSTEAESYLNAVKNATEVSTSRIFKLWLQPELLFRLSGLYPIYEKSLKIMEEVSTNVIISRKKELLENDFTTTDTKNKPFLDFLLTESQFNDEEIHAEVKSFMFAGHDTTTSAICFCIGQLAKYPDVQQKVYEEITRILPDDHSYSSIQNLNNLKYTENVIRETLRLYPSVPMIGRSVMEDVTLPSGYKIPANSHINIFIYRIQRNPKIFHNPDDFVPERFDDERLKKSPYAFIPFSAGPRNCIGQRLAMMEIKIVIASLLKNYLLLPTEELYSIRLTSKLILRSKDGIPIKLKKR